MIIFTREFYSHKNSQVSIEQGPERAPQPLWQFWRRDKSLAPAGIRKPYHPKSAWPHQLMKKICVNRWVTSASGSFDNIFNSSLSLRPFSCWIEKQMDLKVPWLFLVNKTSRCTEIQFYWYYDSTCFGQPFCLSSGVLSRISALVHFMQLWWPFATRSRMELLCSSILPLVANGHHNCIKCTKTDVRLRTPDDRQKGCPKHVES